MKIINSLKYAEQFNELYDWVDDDTVETLGKYEKNDFDVIDYDALEQGEVPVIEIDDGNVERVLVDNLQEPQMQDPIIEEPEVIPDEEIAIEGEDVPDFSSAQEAMEWAIENNRVVKIFYTTKGERRGRGGKKYLKREEGLPKNQGGGVSIYRTVEPHYIYQAGNGNLILVTYDRSVRRIRAFIIDNITEYNFTKNRRTEKPQYFKPRIKIIPKSNKRVDTMENNIKDNLIEMEAKLKSKGLIKSAAIIQKAEDVFKNLKTAQYVGVQGYWIRNRRCWDNCYRQKRTTQPETPAQEVWMECWDEYNKSINNNESGWEKYAERNKNLKISSKDEKEWNKLFISKAEKKVKEGLSKPEAVYATIKEESEVQLNKVLESSSQLMEIADSLHNNGLEDLGKKLAKISAQMMEESDFFVSTDVEKEAQFTGNNPGGFWRGLASPLERGGKWLADKWTGKGGKSDVVKKIQDVIYRANKMLTVLNASQQVQQTQAGSNVTIIETGKKMRKIAQAPPSPPTPDMPLRSSFDITQDPKSERSRQLRNKAKQQQQKQKNQFADDEAYQAQQRGIEQQRIDQAIAEQQDTDRDGVVDSIDVDDNGNNIPDVQEQSKDQFGMKQKGMLADVGKEYGIFLKDATNLVKELSGYATSGDEEAKNYASQATPVLQAFINNSNQQFSTGSKGVLRESLQNLVQGLQSVLSGQESQIGDPQSALTTPATQSNPALTMQPSTQVNPVTQPFMQGTKPNMLNLDEIDQLDEATLISIKTRIDTRLNAIKKTMNRASSYNHKIKFMK